MKLHRIGPPVAHLRAALLACTGLLPLVLALAGGACTPSRVPFVPRNERPSVELTAAPVSAADTAFYSYRVYWSGYDPDGRVESFEYAIDPPSAPDSDTLWITTRKNEEQVFFRSTHAYFDPRHGWRSNDFHVFVVRAVDNLGARSRPVSRAFYSYTIAPVVFITRPQPSSLLTAQVTPSVRVQWTGHDDDGVFTQKPVRYKYRLFRTGDPEFDPQVAIQQPDSLRLYYAARNFAGWDSVSGDTTWAQFTALTPGSFYLFVVVGFDEAGAYSPAFSTNENMLKFTVGFANTLGPVLTLWGDFFYYRYPSGGFSLDPLAWVNLEIPAGSPLTVHWRAEPPEGAIMEWYRWRIDGDVFDETPRTDESTDWQHWSRKSNLSDQVVVGPFPGGRELFFYVQCMDNNGMTSLGILHLKVIQPTFAKELLIIDDTRLEPDKFSAAGVPLMYPGEWPSAAELDTFLYARGGFPWRGPQGMTGNLPLSRPGVFFGYSCDTLGTRQGYELANAGVPLSTLSRYRNLIWMTDATGASPTAGGTTAPVNPTSTLKWMSEVGRANTLATYVFAGGRAWLLGGTAGYCTTVALNAVGTRNNDGLYGPFRNVFSSAAGEIVPGRIMYSAAFWRSEFTQQVSVTTPTRSARAVGGWTNPGWNYTGTVRAPDYAKLPPTLRRRSLALGDTLPPTRNGRSNYFYSTGSITCEYLDQDNAIIEDMDPGPFAEDQRAALDTLYEFSGGSLSTAFTGRTPIAMTYYHGTQAPPFLFSGFNLWAWSRVDVVALVDFVLHDVWGMNRTLPTGGPSAAAAPARAAPAVGPGRRASLPSAGARR